MQHKLTGTLHLEGLSLLPPTFSGLFLTHPFGLSVDITPSEKTSLTPWEIIGPSSDCQQPPDLLSGSACSTPSYNSVLLSPALALELWWGEG